MREKSKIPLLGAALLAVCLAGFLAGCPSPPRKAPSAGAQEAASFPKPEHLGRAYDVAANESLLTIRVYRGGPLAKAGHNHVIASQALRGSLYVPVDLAQSSFEIRMPVIELTVDEPGLRAEEHSDDFPPDVPDSAKEGTRHNMLSPALLDGDEFPEIVLRSQSLEQISEGEWRAHIEATVREKTNTVVVPVHFVQHADVIEVSGEFPLKQSELGLTPFSALLGALQVLDEMKVRFHIVAHAAVTTP